MVGNVSVPKRSGPSFSGNIPVSEAIDAATAFPFSAHFCMPVSQRLEWIDLFRGLAVLGMIWTHSAHTFLEPAVRTSAWFQELDYYHGLIAPAFFWIAGFVRAHVTVAAPKRVWPTMKRLLMVMLIGYLLHVSWYSVPGLSADEWREALKVDVLQCLAVSGMLLLIIERLGRWRYGAGAALMVAFVFLQTPAESWRTGLLPFDHYLNHNQGSLFPLFPWVGFGLAGFVTRAVWDGTPSRRAAAMAMVAALLALVRPASAWLGQAPSFFLERLGWITLAALLISCATAGIIAASGWLRLAGRESLLLYVAHLIIIYSLPTPWGSLQQIVGPTQPAWAAALIALGLFATTLGLGWTNERRKASRRRRA